MLSIGRACRARPQTTTNPIQPQQFNRRAYSILPHSTNRFIPPQYRRAGPVPADSIVDANTNLPPPNKPN